MIRADLLVVSIGRRSSFEKGQLSELCDHEREHDGRDSSRSRATLVSAEEGRLRRGGIGPYLEAPAPISRGLRRRPQLPGGSSKTPAQAVPQLLHRPSRVRFQDVISYQSRPITRDPQAWQ